MLRGVTALAFGSRSQDTTVASKEAVARAQRRAQMDGFDGITAMESANTVAAPLVCMDHGLKSAAVPVAVPQLPARQLLCVCRRCVYFLCVLFRL